MNKTSIKNFAVWAREKLIKDISYKASLLGISEKGIKEALPQSTGDLKFYDIGTKEYAEVSGNEIKQREALVTAIKEKEKDTKNYKEAFEFIIEEVAYTWFNRLIAIRFMEVNDYLPSGIRVLSSENPAKNEPDFVTNPFEAELDLKPFEEDKILELKDQNKSDELFRMLFIKQCNELNKILPELFERTNDYTELLLTISFTDKDGIVYRLVNDINEDDFNVEKEGQVEIIGWMYQYYNTEPKANVFARAKGEKIKKDQVPAATQLFTPDWIVRYMVENSLGRLWYEGHSDSNIKGNWKYYLDEAEQEAEVQEKLNKIKEEYKAIKPEDIKLLDPCMGSGHILVYAFDVLMQIYESYGYTQRDAASLIIENNIYGLDIDQRAAQLSYFAIMMKGRQYDRRFLTREVKPHIYDIPNMDEVDSATIQSFGDHADIAKRICDSFIDGKEYGSLISPNVTIEEIEILEKKIEEMNESIADGFSFNAIIIVQPIIDIVKTLVQKYDVVVTNPPYMGLSNGGAKLNNYVKKNYPNSKSDLFAVFIERCALMVKENRFQAMITMHSWMFLTSFEKLREKLLLSDTVNMVHLGARAFEEISGEVVQTTSWIQRKSYLYCYKGVYCRLIEPNTQKGKENMFLAKENRFISNQNSFEKIPECPIAYWISSNFIKNYNYKFLSHYGDAKQGLISGDNDRFLRLWHEIDINKMNIKWYPYNKGGEFRRWYGNNVHTINWENNGFEIRNFKGDKGKLRSRTQNIQYFFRENISWTKVTTGKFSTRYIPKGYIFSDAGSSYFANKEQDILYYLAFTNSVVAQAYLESTNPTMNYGVGQVCSLPFRSEIISKDEILKYVQCNVNISKSDWDSFETSWDFKKHPLIQKVSTIEEAYKNWENQCEERFNTLKVNEEELNRIFIDIYGLNKELTPEVEDKDVTVRKADLQRDIKSLISYAVGCMLGRYSLDVDGLAFAGGSWDSSKYRTFIPDEDNCIPVTDEEYFKDDIVGRFCEFIKIVFGEDSLEENLSYIADALGTKGESSEEIIRNYFLKEFIKDHIKIYKKRPIYWMFDSGKENGFKALVYMHRWNADTIGNMRVEYLHKMQKVYEKEIKRMQEEIDDNNDRKKVNNARKRKEKLQKQLKESKEFDAKVAHLALSRIDIDFDDGVKVNYEKVQTSKDGDKMQILIKI